MRADKKHPLPFPFSLRAPRGHTGAILLLEGVGAKGKGEPIIPAATTQGIARSYIIGKDNDLLADGAADFLEWDSDPLSPFFPQPEGEASSKRTIEDVARLGIFRKPNLSLAIWAHDGLHA